MSQLVVDEHGQVRHSDDIVDIITAPPSWLMRWGSFLFLAVLILIFSLSIILHYPDAIKTQLKIISSNSPKAIGARETGKLSNILVHEKQKVVTGETLAYLESTATHKDVLQLLDRLKTIRKQLNEGRPINEVSLNLEAKYDLGELQGAYQTFIQSFLSFRSSINAGFWVQKKILLQKDLVNLSDQKTKLVSQKSLQQNDLRLADEAFRMHKKLAAERVETPNELREAESKYLAKQIPIGQTDAAIIAASTAYTAKLQEILQIENQMSEAKTSFFEALNSIISEADDWKTKYVLTASQNGRVSFAGDIQQNQIVKSGEEVFFIISENSKFFGQMTVPQPNMGKVKLNQRVIIKLHSYPYEQYGIIEGRISLIKDVAYRDSLFLSDVSLNVSNERQKNIHLKYGMIADAEIITEDESILKRILNNLLRLRQ